MAKKIYVVVGTGNFVNWTAKGFYNKEEAEKEARDWNKDGEKGGSRENGGRVVEMIMIEEE